MKKKHNSSGIKTNKCPHCQETFPSIIAIHQHILEDHQNIVAEEREEQEMERMKKNQEKAERERMREENRKKRMEKRKDKVDFNDFRHKGLQEWEINYEFHIGEGLVRGVDWDRTPSNGDLNCDICDKKFEWRYELMFHNLCHKTDEYGYTKNRVCPECDTAFKVPIGLKHHLLLHTGELPFLCLHCWRSFSSHIDLKLHIRKEHLFHLEPPVEKTTPKKSLATAKIKQERKHTPAGAAANRRIKEEAAAMAAMTTTTAADGTETLTTTVTLSQNPDGTHQIIQGGEEAGENVELVMANQQDENGDNQTILVGADGTIVHTGNQDMIVVIQSDDFDQSQGLIVVDPSQLQQMVGPDGVPVTVVQAQDGSMVLSEEAAAAAGEEPVDSKQVVVQQQQPQQQQQQQEQQQQEEQQMIAVTQDGTRVLLSQEEHDQLLRQHQDNQQMQEQDNTTIVPDDIDMNGVVVTEGNGTSAAAAADDDSAAAVAAAEMIVSDNGGAEEEATSATTVASSEGAKKVAAVEGDEAAATEMTEVTNQNAFQGETTQ